MQSLVDTIKKAATLKNRFMMLSLTSQDLIALEGHYHKICSREYTQKVKNLSTLRNEYQSFSGTDFCKTWN